MQSFDNSRGGDQLDALIASSTPLVVEFGATWCPPCKQLEPVLGELAERFRGRVHVVSINIESDPQMAARFHVRSVPTLLALRDGQVVASQVGFGRRAPVLSLFEELLGIG